MTEQQKRKEMHRLRNLQWCGSAPQEADKPWECVCDHENFELAARQSKCPKNKIHFKMLLFRIFIHRSSLIFHSINVFVLHLFPSPLGALHIQMNKYPFTSGSLCLLTLRLRHSLFLSQMLWILLFWSFSTPDPGSGAPHHHPCPHVSFCSVCPKRC